MVLRVVLGSVSGVTPTSNNVTTTQLPADIGASNVTDGVSYDSNGQTGFTQYTYEFVDNAGNLISLPTTITNWVKYAEFPGMRLLKKVKFEVNGNPLIV